MSVSASQVMHAVIMLPINKYHHQHQQLGSGQHQLSEEQWWYRVQYSI